MNLGWIFAYLLLERLFELALSIRNRRRSLARGGREYSPGSFRALAVMHALFLLALAFEAYPWSVPIDSRTAVLLTCFALLQAGRYWCIWALGEQWNARIVVVPGAAPVRRGPYRFLRHPNYLVVTLEFLVIPLLMRAPVTLAVFSVANLLLLKRRIRLEEEVLMRETDYRQVFAMKGEPEEREG